MSLKFYKDYSSIIFNAVCDPKQGKWLKILTLKQMLQRIPLSLAQVKAGITSENLLNEIQQIIYSLHKVEKS